MFNIQRYDPSLPSTASTSSTTGLTDLARKIEERQRKRKALDEGPAGDAPEASAAPVVAASVVEEWRPAAGESPAEREKREKREKRAQRMGPGVSFNTVHQGPSGSMYVPPPQAMGGWEKEEGSGVISIHPDRMGAPALKQESKKAEKVYVEKTVAKKNYLKKKRERSKARTKSEAPSLKKLKTSKTTAAAVGEAGEDVEENSDDSDDERYRIEKEEKKRAEIIKKKEERKIKRDEKKAEQRVLKAAGLPPIMPTPRVLPRSAVIAPIVEPTVVVESAEPTAEELELQVFEEEKRARKESKRLKRTTRRHSPPPEPIVAVEAPIDDAPSTLIPTAAAPHLIPTAPSTLIPTAHVVSIPEVESTDVEMAEVAPVEASEPAPKPAVEPSPLYRLPSATRPAPPSAKVLSALNVHESVRAKRIVDPDFRLPFLSTGAKEGEDMRVSERGVKRLAEMGVTEAFAVQTAVLPLLLEGVSALYRPFDPPRDICVSAPTGSGKTLSYVVPIVETLSTRVVTRLRALVLLPTRDLVQQVRETFELFGKGTGLKVGTATGQHSFAHEQVSLVGDAVPAGLQGGSSQVDILIATPGRLMDHIRSTPGFSLQHLRYLVIDEADRLLNQSFHDWLPSILAALKPPASLHASTSSLESGADVLAPEWWDTNVGRVASDVDERSLASCQKLLLSATLSRDPAKIDALHLHRPIFISVEDPLDPDAEDEEIDEELKFTLPATLSEHMIVSPSTHKPLYLFHLLHTLSLDSALCFTKSVEAATRLAKLVELFEEVREAAEPPVVVVEGEEAKEEKKKVVVKSYSSELPPNERTKILASFKKGEIQMLICSDLVSRGIDLPHVSHVISYDVPTDMRKYVHRVGRTARAGKTGDAWSLVEDQEAAPFKAIMNSAQHLAKIKRVRVKDHLVEPFVPHYQVALERLRKHFATGRDQAE